MQSAGCRLCRIAQEARGESTDGLAAGIHGQINSTSCEGIHQRTTVATATHGAWNKSASAGQDNTEMHRSEH